MTRKQNISYLATSNKGENVFIHLSSSVMNMCQQLTMKYLGANLDEQLTFKKHIATKCSVAACNLYKIIKLKRYLSDMSMKTLMSALVLSHFEII